MKENKYVEVACRTHIKKKHNMSMPQMQHAFSKNTASVYLCFSPHLEPWSLYEAI